MFRVLNFWRSELWSLIDYFLPHPIHQNFFRDYFVIFKFFLILFSWLSSLGFWSNCWISVYMNFCRHRGLWWWTSINLWYRGLRIRLVDSVPILAWTTRVLFRPIYYHNFSLLELYTVLAKSPRKWAWTRRSWRLALCWSLKIVLASFNPVRRISCKH